MDMVIESWTEETNDDFLKVVRSRFPNDALSIARRMLANPLRSICASAGDIAYECGVPKCVQGAILRRLYYKDKPFYGVVGGMLGAEKDASPVSIVNVMKRTMASRGGSVLYFGNTACERSLKMNRMLGVREIVPESCSSCRYAVVRWFPFAAYVLERKVFKLPMPEWKEWHKDAFEYPCRNYVLKTTDAIDYRFANFWERYVKDNKGLVSARDVETLRWLFGERLGNREIVVITADDADGMVGYAIIKPILPNSRKWMVLDIVALHNNSTILEVLLKGVKRYLRQCSNAIMVELFGLNDQIQATLKRQFSFRKMLPNEFFLYKWQATKDGVCFPCQAMNSQESWFFGPYDGDMCM